MTTSHPNTPLQNRIGLAPEASEQLAFALGDLLANYSVFYQNVRGFHWNVRGEKFFELHAKFEELYTDLLLKVDEVAERVLTLGHTPEHTYSTYLNTAVIEEATEVHDGRSAVTSILDAFKKLLIMQRRLLAQAGEAEDEGTAALMSDYIREQEKLVWMYSAYLQ